MVARLSLRLLMLRVIVLCLMARLVRLCAGALP
nr:MAG TPA: hypothetical protein [Inoviridae sp.]